MYKTIPLGRVATVALITVFPFIAAAQNFNIQLDDIISDGVPGVGAGRIDVHTENDYYTFVGTAGQSLFVEEINVAASFAGWLRWELKSPGNVTVFSSYLDNNNEGRRTLPETGTYTLRVWVGASNPDYIGTYGFRLRTIPVDQVFPIEIGDTITNGVPEFGAGNIELPGAWDYYTFTGTNGQHVFVEILQTDSTFQGYLFCELKTPTSNTVFSSYVSGGNNLGRRTLTETGTYRLRVNAQSNNPNHTGAYSIRLRPIPPDQYFAIQAGDTVTENVPAAGAGIIDAAGAWDHYTFPALAGQGLTFEAISKSASFNGWLQWELRSPSGVSVFHNFFADSGRRIMPETGTYTLRVWVGSNQPDYIGNYSFRIYTLPGDVRLNIQKGDVISDGVPVTGAGRIDEPGGLDTYTFSGIAGQRVNFEQLSAAPEFKGWLFWEVIAPSGTNWFSNYFPGNQQVRRTLPETGNYTIRVYVQSSNADYIGAYSFRTWCEVIARPDQLTTLPDTAITVPFGKFFCNDEWEIGDAPVIALTNSVTANGGTAAVVNANLVYTPPVGFTGVDYFTYRLAGTFGDDDFATVSVRVGSGVDQGATVVSLNRESADYVMVCLFGAPLQNYRVEESINLTNWTTIGQITADATGSMTYHFPIEVIEKKFFRFPKQ